MSPGQDGGVVSAQRLQCDFGRIVDVSQPMKLPALAHCHIRANSGRSLTHQLNGSVGVAWRKLKRAESIV
jgi:hypothetical protein